MSFTITYSSFIIIGLSNLLSHILKMKKIVKIDKNIFIEICYLLAYLVAG